MQSGWVPSPTPVVDTTDVPIDVAFDLGASAPTSSTPVPDPLSIEPMPSEMLPIVPVTSAPMTALTGWAAVDEYLDATILRGGSAAASIAVLQDGVLQHAASYGERVVDEPAEPLDRFRVASISKTIATVAALQLVEDGVLSLDDPVGVAVSELVGVAAPVNGVSEITLRDLLTHRSGFPQYENLFFANEVSSCPEAAIAGVSRPLQSIPGTAFQYSNMNFCIVGLVLELATGQPYADVVNDTVLTPLGISDMTTAATFDLGPLDVEHRSRVGRNYMETLGAAGAWLATPADLVSILNSLDASTPGVKLLEPETLEMMKTITFDPSIPLVPPALPDASPVETAIAVEPLPPSLPPAPSTAGYGMGLMIFDLPAGGGSAQASYGHTGTLESTHAMMVRRSDGLTWAITVSGDYPGSTRDLAQIVDNALLLGGFLDTTFATVPPPIITTVPS